MNTPLSWSQAAPPATGRGVRVDTETGKYGIYLILFAVLVGVLHTVSVSPPPLIRLGV
jgi:hypothetical protein